MELTRTPFQGVGNIVRFNWPFYVVAGILLIGLMLLQQMLPEMLQILVWAGIGFALVTIIISLLVSYYVYDFSDLYQLSWLKNATKENVLNISAGFDETSELIKLKFPKINLTICDFYDPEKHTEASIKRARKIYPPPANTISVTTHKLPFKDHQFDQTLAILSAHEIREELERILFFRELQRVTKPAGHLYVLEHLRDPYNFIAYTIGFLHFHSKKTWIRTFLKSDLEVQEIRRINPFITLFILKLHGNTP